MRSEWLRWLPKARELLRLSFENGDPDQSGFRPHLPLTAHRSLLTAHCSLFRGESSRSCCVCPVRDDCNQCSAQAKPPRHRRVCRKLRLRRVCLFSVVRHRGRRDRREKPGIEEQHSRIRLTLVTRIRGQRFFSLRSRRKHTATRETLPLLSEEQLNAIRGERPRVCPTTAQREEGKPAAGSRIVS